MARHIRVTFYERILAWRLCNDTLRQAKSRISGLLASVSVAPYVPQRCSV